MTHICTVSPLDFAWETHDIDLENNLQKAVLTTFDKASIPDIISDRYLEATISLTNDDLIKHLNLSYKGQDKTTNVLSFASIDDPDFLQEVKATPPQVPVVIGDVMLAYGTIIKEAKEQGKSIENHLTHLVIHGVLHLLGYNHENDKDANAMESLECNILAQLNIDNPYTDIQK